LEINVVILYNIFTTVRDKSQYTHMYTGENLQVGRFTMAVANTHSMLN